MSVTSLRELFRATAVLCLLSSCSNVTESLPERTATEQLLISTAADKAIARLEIPVPPGASVYFDSSRFAGYDSGYALGVLRTELLRHGAALMDSRKEADLIVEARAGALSINDREDLIGLPSFPLPIPLAGVVDTPQIALFKQSTQVGVAKIGLTGYWRETGRIAFAKPPAYGLAWRDSYSVIGVGWVDGDVTLEEIAPQSEENSSF